MIISASRRTDIPAHYAEWFMRRVRDGYAVARNPMNPRQERRVSLRPEDVDAIVFWTKNPAPMLLRLAELADYAYYFQFTVTPYGPDIEPGVPDKEKEIIPVFRRLADTIGPERVIWRCDPLLVGKRYGVDFHLRSFEKFARAFEGFTRRCVFSYLDIYRGMSRAARELGFRAPDEAEKLALARELAPMAQAHGMTLESCAEDINLEQFGILHTSCIDAALIEKITGRPLARAKDKNQRPHCRCAPSIDIGAYDTCPNGCKYCYATHSAKKTAANIANHDIGAPYL